MTKTRKAPQELEKQRNPPPVILHCTPPNINIVIALSPQPETETPTNHPLSVQHTSEFPLEETIQNSNRKGEPLETVQRRLEKVF